MLPVSRVTLIPRAVKNALRRVATFSELVPVRDRGCASVAFR